MKLCQYIMTMTSKMKRVRYQIIAFLCIISGILILMTTFYRNRGTAEQVKPITHCYEGPKQYNTSTATPEKLRDGLPESAQLPRDEDIEKLDETALLNIYWKYINMLHILCKDVIRVGSLKDGGKEICIDPGYKPQAPCLVYSFGINNMFDFDKTMVENFGCEVHCFDPSMTNESRRLSEHMWFYRWGLGGKNEINSKQWNIKTLDTIRRELGHTNRTIDLLKIDIEGDEWSAIPQMISSGALEDIRQISMETHFSAEHANQRDFWGKIHPRKQLSALRQLYDYGFRTFMRERNMWSYSMWHGIKGYITNVNEVSMIKPKR